jgi:protein required for attachment to host cells
MRSVMSRRCSMSDYLIVVASAARARFFTLEPAEFPDLESGPTLVDQGELLNPQARVPERDLFADSKTGRGRAPRGGSAHGYDDHREQHEDESERRFSREILEKARLMAEQHDVREIVLAGSTRAIPFLRQDVDRLMKQGRRVQELIKDMTKLTSEQIQDHLAKEELLPARRRPGR